jgi:beta-lactamase class D
VFGETTEDHRYVFPVAGGSYPPVQVQEISFMLLPRITEHVRSPNRTAVGIDRGVDGERRYLQKIGYGNADPSGGVDRFWLDGKLAISAAEQVAFLQQLYRNELPFRVEHQRLVKDVLFVEAGRDWILRARTGWQARLDSRVGWWVGWVERPEGPAFFALNIEMPNEGADLPKREAIARAVLRSIGALPPEPTPHAGAGT